MNNGIREIKVIQPTTGMITKEKIKTAAYCRVSTDSADQINSFMAQMRHYSEYIRHHDDMVFVDIYADEGITGTSISKRDEFKRMLKDCKNRKIDRILVKSVQRFARNSLECIETVRVLAENGVSVYFENDGIDTKTMNSEMILYIKSAFAQGESMAASKRMSTSVRMKMEDGTFVTTTAPYGYRLTDKQLVICPEEADIVRQIFAWYLSGLGMNAIVTRLNAQDNLHNWTVSHIRYILSNEKYIGDMLMQKTYTPDILPLRNRRNCGARAKYYSESTHEAIVTAEVFEAARKLKKEREDKYQREKTTDKGFFGGMIYCRECGWAYKRIMRKGDPIWLCSKKGATGVSCRSHSYSEKTIFSTFVRMYNRFRQNEKSLLDETIAQLQCLMNIKLQGNAQVSDIDEELANLCDQITIYSRLHVKGVIDDISYLEKTDNLKKRIDLLRLRRNKLLDEDDDHCIEDLRHLKNLLKDEPSSISEGNEHLLALFVTKIYAEQNGDLTFCLLGDLHFRIEVR